MKKWILFGTLLATTLVVWAHEYLLLAEKYRLNKGDDLKLHLFVADGFNIQLEGPFRKAPTKSFELITANGVTDLATKETGTLPVIDRKVDFEGGGLFHLERNYARITLETPKFLDYLKEDHIENIASKVDKAKPHQKERYTRYIKCLVQSGSSYSDTLYKRVTGQAFEILLLQNPYSLAPGKSIKARILFEGKPLAGKIITARNRTGSEPAIAQTVRTDKEGNCTFRLSRKGEWVIHATHMIICPDKEDSDWESFWTSYSFAIE